MADYKLRTAEVKTPPAREHCAHAPVVRLGVGYP